MTHQEPFTDIVAALSRPEAYPWRPPSVELIETHISWVFLAGDRVLKLKRPVKFGFVDFTSPVARRQAVDDEVRLNRRLTTDVYLGVATVTEHQGTYRVAVERARDAVACGTLMRRLPAERMLDRLLAAGPAPADLADRLAARLVPFHRDSAERCGGAFAEERPETIVAENLDELRPFVGNPLPPALAQMVEQAMRDFLTGQADLLTERSRQGWVREGHGDLRAEHVCLEDDGAVQVFDCVEFSLDIRCADVASDLAFLLMDLERLDAAPTAHALAERYRAAGIPMPEDLLRFYRAHRALVRAKIACLTRHGQSPNPTDSLAWEAVDYLHVAAAAALTAQPALIVMTGLSGTGKSTVARALARALRATMVSTDMVRRERGINEKSGWQEGAYRPDRRASIYEELYRRAEAGLGDGQPVILDGTFLDDERRGEAAATAAAAGVPLLFVETVAEESVVRDRLAARAAAGSASDATFAIYQRQRADLDAAAPSFPPGAFHARIDTTSAAPFSLDPAFAILQHADAVEPMITNSVPSFQTPYRRSERT